MLSSFSYIIPTSNKILVFLSYPDYSDNAYAFYKYLISKRKDCKYVYIWIISNKSDYHSLSKLISAENTNAKVYCKFSFWGLWYIFRAKKIFCTHGLTSAFNLKQHDKIVNLWHGMPLKVVGSLDSKNKYHNPTQADYLIASSEFFQEIMSKCFNNLSKTLIFITGLPRNDLMFEPTDFYLKNNISKEQYNSVGIWLPTYRSSIISNYRVDGKFEQGKIAFLSKEDLLSLNTTLLLNNDLLIIKIHPMDELQAYPFPILSNIIIIKQNDFTSQLYPLLGSTDYLLTDYSSVWIDYEILGRPIGFIVNDFEEFLNTRGFTIEDLDKKLPGPIIETYAKLIEFIANPEKLNNQHSNLFNLYRDNNSSERLAEILKL